jgi:hypothetical protein
MGGMLVSRWVPGHHLDPASKDVIKLTIGLIATLSALVLGMLIAVANGSYQTQRNEVQRLAAQILLLDRVLAQYGPEAGDARAALRDSVVFAAERMWPTAPGQHSNLDPGATRERSDGLWNRIISLQPRAEEQRAMRARALEIGIELTQDRYMLLSQQDSAIPVPVVVVLLAWLALIFTGFGLMAPANATVAAAMFTGALCVAGALFLLIELAQPFDGLIRLSSDPLRHAIALLGR